MPPRARAQALSRRHRFTGPGAFGPALRSGRKVRGDTLVLHAARASGDASRVGIALSRRHVPSAVARNRIKRIVREAFRRHPLKHCEIHCVFALRERVRPEALVRLPDEVARLLDELQRAERR
ncbi:MAG TPA: ribonuclease P protein component [Usitatibacter sp.]|jgi:ribonuclease P protein component|nr:ribonuclease P protein component [Usitatibacter sp.]